MNDIFISYDRNDRARAQKFADALAASGWSVWWDREITLGKSFDQVIEEELNGARCVLVLWSKDSVQSRWVKSEASAALDKACLLPVFIDRISSPLEFRLIEAAELWDWDGNIADPEFQRLLHAIRRMCGQPEPAVSVLPTSPPVLPKPTVRASPARFRPLTAAMVVIAVLFFGWSSFQRIWQRKTPSAAETAPVPTSSNRPPLSSTSPGDSNAFSIKVGGKIDDGIPAAGAGSIDKPYELDHYVFTAKPGQRVYFRVAGYSAAISSINLRLTDDTDTEVFRSCFGCTEPGVQRLSKGGTYTLTVGAEKDPSTGMYQLQLFDVPPPSQFSIRIGDVIEENKPGAGAGVIESPGAEDVYTFMAPPRQRVYFRMFEHSTGMSSIGWRLVDDNGMEVFKSCFACTEPGLQTLIKGGTYVLTVGNKTDPATGLYRLQLFNVQPPERFTTRLGDKIRPGFPGAGAGMIETPGAEDVYVFTAQPGQKVSFHLAEHGKGMDSISWRLVDDNGMEVFKSCFGCSDPGLQTLTKGGTYTLTVGNNTNPATGNYSIEIGSK